MRVSCIDVRPFMATPHNCILAICCALEMDLYTQSVCSNGCSSYFLNNLTSVHWVSIGLTDMHGGFMHCCPSMHGYPPWVTTHWKSDPPFTCIWMGKAMPLALFIMCIAWVAACSLGFERVGGGGVGGGGGGGGGWGVGGWGGGSDTWGFHAHLSAHAWLSITRNYTLGFCPTFQINLFA